MAPSRCLSSSCSVAILASRASSARSLSITARSSRAAVARLSSRSLRIADNSRRIRSRSGLPPAVAGRARGALRAVPRLVAACSRLPPRAGRWPLRQAPPRRWRLRHRASPRGGGVGAGAGAGVSLVDALGGAPLSASAARGSGRRDGPVGRDFARGFELALQRVRQTGIVDELCSQCDGALRLAGREGLCRREPFLAGRELVLHGRRSCTEAGLLGLQLVPPHLAAGDVIASAALSSRSSCMSSAGALAAGRAASSLFAASASRRAASAAARNRSISAARAAASRSRFSTVVAASAMRASRMASCVARRRSVAPLSCVDSRRVATHV